MIQKFSQILNLREVHQSHPCKCITHTHSHTDPGYLQSKNLPGIKRKNGCQPVLQAQIVEVKTVAGRARRRGARICSKLSKAVRGNSDWWEIGKTDCMGWWTAVSPRNLAISHPAELTIASTRRLLFQSRVVILPVSRLLVRCQLRAEASIAQPRRWRYVWNDMSCSRPNIERNTSLEVPRSLSFLKVWKWETNAVVLWCFNRIWRAQHSPQKSGSSWLPCSLFLLLCHSWLVWLYSTLSA